MKQQTTFRCLVLLLLVVVVVVVTATTDAYATTNYASAFLGAKLVDYHKEAKGVHHLLNEDKEKYMIIPCDADKKRFTIQLSREIELSMIALSNLEYFSSPVKEFMLVGSSRFPCVAPACLWRVLGSFEAKFTRTTQYFQVPRHSSIRYLRFLWISQHGNEKFCTMTTLQAYGTDVLETLAAELSHDVEEHRPAPVVQAAGPNNASNITILNTPNGTRLVVNTVNKSSNSVAKVFVRNASATMCFPHDREVEDFFEIGLGAVCSARVQTRIAVQPPLMALPHLTRQMKSVLSDVQKLQQSVGLLTTSFAELNATVQALRDSVTRDEKTIAFQLDSLRHQVKEFNRRIVGLTAQVDLRAKDESNSEPILALIVWTAISNVVALVALFCAYARKPPQEKVLRRASSLAYNHPLQKLLEDDD